MKESAQSWLRCLQVPGKPDEHEAKKLLADGGLRIPRGLRLGPDDQQTPEFEPPYIVKVCSAEVLHKTDRGGVQMSVQKAGLAAAVGGMRARFPGAGVLVEEQVSARGMEFIIGAFQDPSFGPALMVGAGGILTELYRDVAFRLVPCTAREARRMLEELKVFPALEGFRGLSMDAAALAETIARVSTVVEALGDRFVQMDINPIVFTPAGWTVLDAKLILGP